jgi:hypothetical protein
LSPLSYLGAGEAATLWSATTRTVDKANLLFGTTEGIYAGRVYDELTISQCEELWFATLKNPYAGEDIRADLIKLGARIKAIQTPASLLAYDPANPPQRQADSAVCTPISKPAKRLNSLASTLAAPTQNRPAEGLKTAFVWSIADTVLSKYPGYNKKQLKEEVIETCVQRGINPSTAQVQFGKWCITKSL